MAVFIKQNNQLVPVGNMDDPVTNENTVVQRTAPIFQICNNTTASFVGSWAFAFSPLKEINLANCISISEYAFMCCSTLTTASFSACSTVGNCAFMSCYNLKTVSFSACTSIANSAFRTCYNLYGVYLLASTIPSLASTDVFTTTPISDYTSSTGGVYGSIFVRASLASAFKTAAVWSAYSARIVGLTDTEIANL